MQPLTPKREIYTVSLLNNAVNQLLQTGLPLLWVEGEISNFAHPGSGHMYFSLKDAGAQVRTAMFRNRNIHLNFTPKNGMQILARVRIGLYEPRGEFQLLVEHMEAAGDGALKRAFETLKTTLQQEGLFDPARKKSLPQLPHQIGIITSPTGAAIRDTLSVLQRRFPLIPIILYPAQVQGSAATAEICSALQTANKRQECDVLLLVRGGGSLEDLHAFNTETLARAIARSNIPVITGIGHETDFTIADFAADLRAPTPSAAAEHATPDRHDWLQNIHAWQHQLHTRTHQQLQKKQATLTALTRQLGMLHPMRRLQHQAQRIDIMEKRLLNSLRHKLRQLHNLPAQLELRLQHHSPQNQLHKAKIHLARLEEKMRSTMQQRLHQQSQQLTNLSQTLDTVSPLATLQRGYAIAINPSTHTLITDSQQTHIGAPLHIQLSKGKLRVTVKEKLP